MHFLNFSRWTRIERTTEQKSNVLLSLFVMLGTITMFVQVVFDSINGLIYVAFLDAFMMGVLIIIYILNERRKHLSAKIMFLGFINLMLFVFASIVPKEVGVYLYYFPIIGITSLIFDQNTAHYRNIFIGISLISVVILEYSHYHIFGDINIQAGTEDEYSFPMNLIISLIVTVVSIYQMMLINREIEQNRLKISEELKIKNDDLEKSNKELDHFVYSTSHDLKAPLSSIAGLVNIAKHDVSDEVAQDYFNRINGRVDKLNGFIKDIIDLSRNSRLEVKQVEIDPKSLCESIIENNRYMHNADNIDFRLNINANNKIFTDRARLEVVLNNLVSNAIKYHKKEGDRYIELSMEVANSSLFIEVRDNGIGIKEEHQSKIYDMFYRGHEESEGSGLGLYIVQDVVNKLNGNITINSKENEGTTVSVSIPIF